jgi:hypothetical protein
MPSMVPPGGRRTGLVLVATVVLLARGRGWAEPQARTTLRLCIADQRGERASAALLGRFLSTVRLEASPPPGCRSPGADYLGWFEERAGHLAVVVQARSGEELVRAVPWVRPTASVLSELAAADRLSEFSILVDGVLAEHRSPAPVHRPPAEPITIEPLPPLPPDARRLAPVDDGPAEDRAPTTAAYLAPRPSIIRPPPPPRAAPVRIARLGPARRAPIAVAATPPAPAPREPALSLDLTSAFVVRAPGLAGAQLGAALGWRWLFVAGAVQSTDWSWQRRRIRFRALTAEAGVRPGLLARGRFRLTGLVAAAGEAITLHRLDVAEAASHGYLDLGATAGAEASFRPRPWARLALFAATTYRPTGRRVDVSGGPSIALNAWSGRLGIAAGLVW